MSEVKNPAVQPAANPASKPEAGTPMLSRKRVPMSVSVRKLEVPDMPGYNLYWFLESNVPRALQGGYEPVNSSEVDLNQTGVANSRTVSGNADLGSGVKSYGGRDEEGRAEYLVLMKIRQEWFLEDQAMLQKQNAAIVNRIFKSKKALGTEGVSQEESSMTYVKDAVLQRPPKKVI